MVRISLDQARIAEFCHILDHAREITTLARGKSHDISPLVEALEVIVAQEETE